MTKLETQCLKFLWLACSHFQLLNIDYNPAYVSTNEAIGETHGLVASKVSPKPPGSLTSLGIVIPTYNAASVLEPLLIKLSDTSLPAKILVVDAESGDNTTDIAARHNTPVLSVGTQSRGGQMRSGVQELTSEWYLLLHADSQLPEGWEEAVHAHMNNPHLSQCAAYFRFELDTDDRTARFIERLANWRCRALGMPYGDQGLLISQQLLEACGGVPDIPLMEDVQLVRRLGKNRLRQIALPLRTSAERYQRSGYYRRSVKNIFFVALFMLGVGSNTLRRHY